MSGTVPQEALFGERYEDGGGWEWAVQLNTPDRDDGKRRVGIGSAVSERQRPSDVYLRADPALLRRVAAALNAVADILDRSEAPDAR